MGKQWKQWQTLYCWVPKSLQMVAAAMKLKDACSLLLKNWCFWTVVLEKILESPLDCKEIQLVNPKGNQSWIFIGRTDAEAETPILWPPDVKNWLIGKDPDAGRIEGRKRKGQQRVRWLNGYHQLYGHEFEQALGDGDGQGSLACHSGLQRVRHDWATELTD